MGKRLRDKLVGYECEKALEKKNMSRQRLLQRNKRSNLATYADKHTIQYILVDESSGNTIKFKTS